MRVQELPGQARYVWASVEPVTRQRMACCLHVNSYLVSSPSLKLRVEKGEPFHILKYLVGGLRGPLTSAMYCHALPLFGVTADGSVNSALWRFEAASDEGPICAFRRARRYLRLKGAMGRWGKGNHHQS
jgi:hypothetical protein